MIRDVDSAEVGLRRDACKSPVTRVLIHEEVLRALSEQDEQPDGVLDAVASRRFSASAGIAPSNLYDQSAGDCRRTNTGDTLSLTARPDPLTQPVQVETGVSNPAPPPISAVHMVSEPNRPRLKEQEKVVLRTWLRCSSKRLAAQRLSLTPKTIDTYIEQIRARYAAVGTSAPTKVRLLPRVVEDGLITLAELGEIETE
jgi:DNA-binding CsgD family transcriptional regulator